MSSSISNEIGEPKLRCLLCPYETAIGAHFEGCPACRAKGRRVPLEVIYDYARLRGFGAGDFFLRARSIWDYRKLLPVSDPAAIVTLGEGGTPLLEAPGGPKGVRLYLKNEAQNPTGAFKDRLNSVCISMARQLGYSKVVAVTTGNHGLSAAAYAARAGLRCVVLCHEETSKLIVNSIRAFGADAIVRKDRAAIFARVVRELGWYPTYTMAPLPEIANPYGVEGYKSIAYEIFGQLGGKIPGAVFVPVGGGDALYGIWKGFRELVLLNVVAMSPRMYGCQAAGANPVVRAFQRRLESVSELEGVSSVALSIREPTAGMQTLRVLYESGGEAVEASEEEILDAVRRLACGGILPEPASAVSYACARRVAAQGKLEGQEVVCVLTSTAIKWPEFMERLAAETPRRLPEEIKLLLPGD